MKESIGLQRVNEVFFVTCSSLFLSVVYIVNIGTGFPGYTLQAQIRLHQVVGSAVSQW